MTADDPLFAGGGMMGGAMAVHDWAATPLGPPAGWSPSLRSVVRILLTSRFPMWMGWGAELSVLYNDAYQRDTLRAKHPWALGRPAREVWAEVWPDVEPLIRSVIDTGEATWSERLLLFLERSGYSEETYHTFSYSPLADGNHQVAGFLCVVREDTERVLGERRLRILSELGDISAVSAPTTASACRAALDVLARGRGDIPFASVHLTDPPRLAGSYGTGPDAAEAILAAALAAGPDRTVAGLARRFAGRFVPGDGPTAEATPDVAVAIPLTAGGTGREAGYLLAGVSPFRALDPEYRRFLDLVAGQVSTAIADAQAYQDQRRRAEELVELDRAKTEFFTGVSHELRTPLTLISGPAEDGLADRLHPLPPPQRARMEIILRNGGRLRRLVDTMLDFARLERGGLVPDPVPVDLAGLTRGIAESFAPAILRADLEFTIDCSPLPAAVPVDVDMWEKIVLNLLSNAVKYTLTGSVALSLRLADDEIALTVADTGIGIPATDLPLLFRRFHRVRGAVGRSHEGSGIGLALVSELTALHQGRVGVASLPGRGSTFTVTLPGSLLLDVPSQITSPAAAARYREEALRWSEAAAPATPPTDSTAAAVLVAEDNPDLRQFLAQLLSPHYRVTLAADGAEALALATAAVPDLVLTDVMMPRLDGFGLLAALRADPLTATVPVVMLSARSGEEAAIEGLGAGADDYVVKPFSSHDLLARVRSNLALARLRNHEASWRRALVAALQDGFYVVDADGAVVEVNDAFETITGYGVSGLPYRPPYPWVPGPELDADTASLIDDVLAGHVSGGLTAHLVHRDGRRIWVEAVYNTATDPSSGATVRVGTIRDVTEVKRAERATELLAEIGRLQAEPGELIATITQILRVAAPVLADAAVVSLRRPDGTFFPAAAGAADVDRERQIIAAAADPDVRTALVTPVVSDGKRLATLTFLSFATERHHDDADHALAAEVARRVARMIDTERAAVRDRRMHRFSAALAVAGTVGEAAAAVADGMATLLDATSVTVFATRPGRAPEPLHTVGGRAGDHVAVPIGDAARLGTPIWMRDTADWTAVYPDLVGGHAPGLPAHAALPLTVGARPVGVASIGFAGRRDFESDERLAAQGIAAQAALAFERLALADARREVADTLQRSLLPPALPTLPRLDLAARYLPAALGSKAGGDWYDVLELRDDVVAVVVGDVVGQGPSAAAVMGQLRSALAAYLIDESSPAAALTRLDRFARRVDGARGSSVVCMVIDVVTGAVTWARAGHPPPLVLDSAEGGGGARYLDDAHGCVLGVRGAPPFTEATATLTPGSTVLLYTDGLIERRVEVIDDGLDRLAAAAQLHAARSPAVLIPAVLGRALDGAGPPDDIAVLAARLRPGPLRRTIPAAARQLAIMRRGVRTWAAACALVGDTLDDLQFALGEAVTNAVEHAYAGRAAGTVSYRVEIVGSGIEVEVTDEGQWLPVRPDPGFRGRGVPMMRALTEQFEIDKTGAGTRVRFVVPLDPRP